MLILITMLSNAVGVLRNHGMLNNARRLKRQEPQGMDKAAETKTLFYQFLELPVPMASFNRYCGVGASTIEIWILHH